MKSRILRAVVCFLVICCLVINMSPISAWAIDPATTYALYWAARIVVASIIVGLGISFAEDAAEFGTQSIDGIVQFLKDAGQVVDDKIELWKSGDSYFAPSGIVEAIRSWLFDHGIILETSAPEGYAYYNGNLRPILPEYDTTAYPYAFIYNPKTTTDNLLYVSNVPVGQYGSSFGFEGGTYTYCCYKSSRNVSTGKYGSWTMQFEHFSSSTGISFESGNFIWSNYDIVKYNNLVSVASTPLTQEQAYHEAVIASYVAPEDESLEAGYSDWSAGVLTIPASDAGTDSDVFAYPVALGNDLDETLAFPQASVWAGESTYVDSGFDQEPGLDTGTDSVAGTLAETALEVFLSSLAKTIFGPFEWIWDQIEKLFNPWFESISGWFHGLITGQETGQITLQTILDSILDLPQILIDGLLQALKNLFIPQQGYISAKIDDLRGDYVFADSIARTALDLKSFLLGLGSVPPVIRINLGAATGSYNYGGDIVLVDFSFYEPYKPAMDSILSAFLWLWFVWRVILGLPGIIGGASGAVGSFNTSSNVGSAGYVQTPASAAGVTEKHAFVARPGGDTHFKEWREAHPDGGEMYQRWKEKHK